MTGDSVDAQTIYEALYDWCTPGNLSIYFVPTSHERPRFIIEGGAHRGREVITGLYEIIEEYDPQSVRIENSSQGAHISLIFDQGDVVGEPEPMKDWQQLSPRQKNIQVGESVNECSLCKKRTPPEHPPINIRKPPETPYETPETETHHICIDCGIGHLTDVTGPIRYFGVNESGEVEMLYFLSNDEWVPYENGENPFIDDTVAFIEKKLV